MIYCLVPAELAGELHDPLRTHFAADPSVEVVVEQRRADRRTLSDRRAPGPPGAPTPNEDRRRIRSTGGRRFGERRAVQLPVAARERLPRRARRHATRLAFFERLEPTGEQLENRDTARLVARIQGGDEESFAVLYTRYFDRLYGYLRGALRDSHEAEDVTQQVFLAVLEQLPRYEIRDEPFRNWLFVIARNRALSHLRKLGRIEPEDQHSLDRMRDRVDEDTPLNSLGWIVDRDLLLFIERLPVSQRQVLMLRYMLDLGYQDIGRVLGRSTSDVKSLNHRAVHFLRQRLAAVGRGPSRRQTGSRKIFRPAEVLRHRRFALR